MLLFYFVRPEQFDLHLFWVVGFVVDAEIKRQKFHCFIMRLITGGCVLKEEKKKKKTKIFF
jgi:hypothetical protein